MENILPMDLYMVMPMLMWCLPFLFHTAEYMNKLPALRRQNRYLIAAMVVDVDDDGLLSAGPSSSQLAIFSYSSSIVLLLLKNTNKMSCN
jgi:hypothetical protein